MTETYNNLPLYFATNISAWRGFFRLAESQTIRVAMWGDSQETAPNGAGATYIPAINRELGLLFGNWPETPISILANFGGGSPQADWLMQGNVSGTAASSFAASKFPPGVGPARVVSSANGYLVTLCHDGIALIEKHLYGQYWNRSNTVADIIAVAKSGSSEISWNNTRSGANPSYFNTVLASGTTSLGLDQSDEVVKIATIPIIWASDLAAWPYAGLYLQGGNAQGAEVAGVRFRRTDNAAGMVVCDFAAGGYQATSFAANHNDCDDFVRAIGIDCHWLKVGTNDAYASSVTASAFKTRIENLIDWVREKAGNPIARIIVSSEVFRKDGASELNTEFDQYAGVLYEIAEADPYVLFLNSRLATEIAGWNAATENFAGLTNRGVWSSASVSYVLGDYVSVAAPAGGEIAYYRCTVANTSSVSNGPGTRNWAPHARYVSDQVHYTQAGAMLLANLEVGLIRSVMGHQSQPVASGLFIYNTVSRNVTDTTPILFTWPVAAATITVTRSIDAGSYGAATASPAVFEYTQDGQHFYSLAYSANDRPSGAGSVVYRLDDGVRVRLLPLQVEVGDGGDATLEKQDEILAALEEQSNRPVVVVIPAIEADSLTADSGKLIRYRGTLWSIAVQGLLAIPDKCYFTVKRDDEPDNKAVIQIVKSNPADVVNDGLKILAGSVAANLAHGSITFESYVESDVTKYRAIATVQAEATAILKVRDYRIDFKDTAGDIVLAERELRVVAPVTAATT